VAEALAARAAGLDIQIARRVGENEVLFGSVTTADIAEALTAKGLEVDRRKLQLRDPIKKLGEFEIPLKLHREVVVTLKVRVVAEGSVAK
jgi:large subunit ribosomal protein L9